MVVYWGQAKTFVDTEATASITVEELLATKNMREVEWPLLGVAKIIASKKEARTKPKIFIDIFTVD